MRVAQNIFFAFLLFVLINNVVAQHTKPNILLIAMSDLSWTANSTYTELPPNLRTLAQKGLLFNQAFVNVADGQPARQVMLTGRYPHNNGSWACDNISDTITTLPLLLKKANYYCALLGNEHQLNAKEPYQWDIIVPNTKLIKTPEEAYLHEFNMLIKNASQQNKPFFAMVNIFQTERPFTDHLPMNEADIPPFLPNLPEVKSEITQYQMAKNKADQCVGSILKALNNTGNEENTVIIFLGSNGIDFPFAKSNCYPQSIRTPLIVYWNKMAQKQITDTQNMVTAADIMPTLLDLTNTPNYLSLDGKSLLPVLMGKQTQPIREYVYVLFNGTYSKRSYPMRALYSKDYCYIANLWSDQNSRYKNDSQGSITWKTMITQATENDDLNKRVGYYIFRQAEELFVLADDPYALKNVFSTYHDLKMIHHLKQQLLDEMIKHKDPLTIEYQKRFVEKRGKFN